MPDKFQIGDLVTLDTDPRRRGLITGSTKLSPSGRRKFWQVRMLIWPSNSDPYFNWEEAGLNRSTFAPEGNLVIVVGEKYEEPQVRFYRNGNQEEKMREHRKNQPNAGMSECPICGKIWLVTPSSDCLLPACGCFGHDASEDNPNRPCEKCGITHAWDCKKGKKRYMKWRNDSSSKPTSRINKILQDVADENGVSVRKMLQDAVDGTFSLGVCIKCGFVSETEPDTRRSFCEECESENFYSVLVIAGIM